MATPKDDKLEALEEEIDEARRQAEHDGLIADPDHHPRPFFASGDEQDGPAVTPPG